MSIKKSFLKTAAIEQFQEAMSSLGFAMTTKVQADLGPVCIRLEYAIPPEGVSADPYYRVKIYGVGQNHYIEFKTTEIGLIDNTEL